MSAIIGYEPRITRAINQLLPVIQLHVGKPLDISRWFNFLVFDVMEDLAFNKTSNMLSEGRESYVFETIRMDMLFLAFMRHMPWLLTLIKRTPLLNSNYLKFWKWIQSQIDERKKVNPYPT
jgi:cytochrome P450 family 628